MCKDCQNWNHRRSRESENFSKSQKINYQNFPCDLRKWENTNNFVFCPLIRKLQAFEILKWAQGSQWRKQRTSNFTREIQLIFSRLWNAAFYIFRAVKYSFFIFNKYFPVFHYFVFNKYFCPWRFYDTGIEDQGHIDILVWVVCTTNF